MVSVANTDIDNKGKCVDPEELRRRKGTPNQPSGRAAVRTPVPGPPEDKLASFVRTARPAPAEAFSTQLHPFAT